MRARSQEEAGGPHRSDDPVGEDGHDEAPVPGSMRWWQEHEARLRRRRPRDGGLTIERITATALALVDQEGLEALTVRSLAARLGTGSATLYRHVTSRAELLVLLADHVLGDVRLPPATLPARPRIEHLAAELRRVLLHHPRLMPALNAAPLLGPNALRGAEGGLAALLDAGYEPDVALAACQALINYVLGSVFFDSGEARPPDESWAPAPPEVAYPALGSQWSALADVPGDAVFRFGLRTFLDGLELHRDDTRDR